MAVCHFNSKASTYDDQDALAKRIYWKLITNGDEMNICEVFDLIDSHETRAYMSKYDKTRALKSFVINYDHLFDVSRKSDKGTHILRPVVKIEFCKTFDGKQGCLVRNCPRLHVCRHFIKGKCTFGMKCKKPHNFEAVHTKRILKEHCLDGLSHAELKDFLCRNVQFALEDAVDASNIPKQLEICKYYNVAIGCSREDQCPFLHVCRFFAEDGTCKFGSKCIRSHDCNSKHAQGLLSRYRIRQSDVLLYLRMKREEGSKLHNIDQNGSALQLDNVKPSQSSPKQYSSLTNMKHPITKPRTRSLNTAKEPEMVSIDSAFHNRKFSDPLVTEIPQKQEICERVFQGSCHNSKQCKKLHRKLPFSWEYSLPGTEWEEIGKQENLKLERAFCDVKQSDVVVKLGHKQEFVFKFQHWIAYQKMEYKFLEEISNMTPLILIIRRLSTSSSIIKNHPLDDASFLTTWIWYYKDASNNWCCYDDDYDYDTKEEKRKLCSNNIEIAYQLIGHRTLKFHKEGREFVIDFDRMVQEDVQTGRVCEVRRRPLHKHGSFDEKLQKSESLSQEKSFFPSYWNSGFSSGIPGEDCELIDLQSNSDEYRNVFMNFISSMPRCKIQWIKAVQNPRLWMKYAMKRESLQELGPGAAEEMYLYRSADSTNVDKICISGFGYDIFDTQTVAELRKSCCFAKEARNANRGNTPNQNGSYYMFLCRILINSSVTGIHEDEKMSVKRKDTNGRDSSIFYVFEYDNVFPEFLIMFEL